MKKVFLTSTFFVTELILFLQVKAAYADLCAPGFENLCKLRLENRGAEGIVGKIVSILLILAIVLALLYLVFGGIKYITSGGDKAKIDAARSHITSAIIGLIISLVAYFVINIVTYVFTGSSISGFTIPTLIP